MKKITAFMLMICLCSALVSCSFEPNETRTEATNEISSDTDIQTETETLPAETETKAIETLTDTEPGTETEQSGESAVYKVYDPIHANTSNKGSLVLHDTMKYRLDYGYTERDYGYPVSFSIDETGAYTIEEPGVDLILERKYIEIKITFENDENKEAYLASVKNQYLMSELDGDAYDIVKKAANGGFSAAADELADTAKLYPAVQLLGKKAVLDKEDTTAYFQIGGAELSDNEFYIVDNGYTLILNGDGTCSMRYDSLKTDEKGFGTFIASDIYAGTYTQNGKQVTCTITQDTLKYDFTDDASEQAYKEYYDGQYSGGFLGKVYYDYYMALISEGGYTDDDMSDKYIITLEEHTHTAVILESPETEG